ncbi:osmotically-inducible protein OsmY [Luteibacter jiangsuensis]|uniref:Osmotically-inducible protein OsmY n=1 Tax=Luteibacter jiangsuensis TaxID=637577 RepID=A0ABT9STJ8_9GAMM|nr:BON domain-containing protein [Luteibacter jiangsuensis]MDQ0008314.1 osmotically-inducible protein OsmY [Luteibacter jiangsuensis]
MNNPQLRQNIIEELDFEPSIDTSGIAVAVDDGIVTLSGHVGTYAEKVNAERATWRVKGVKAIAQEIKVRLPFEKKVNDDEVARRAVDILAWNTWVPRDAVKVRVSNGWLTLTGSVKWDYQRREAEKAVRKLSGVLGVTNEIALAPAIQATDIRQRINDALKRHAEVEAGRIRVDVSDGGHVHIEGDVDNWDERQAVERAVWSAPGVQFVEDRVRIL